MNRSTLSATAVAVALTSACGGAVGLGIQPSYGIVVKYEAMPGTTIKRGIDALSDTGRRLFGPSSLVPPTRSGLGRDLFLRRGRCSEVGRNILENR